MKKIILITTILTCAILHGQSQTGVKKASSKAKNANFIKTPLDVVYEKDSVFYILPGLDLNRKHEVWGFKLSSGICVEKGLGNYSWYDAKRLAEAKVFNGTRGELPPKKLMKKYDKRDKDKFWDTREILVKNDISAFGYVGGVWCCDQKKDKAYEFFISQNTSSAYDKNEADMFTRLAVYFPNKQINH